jgi:hypothetical protein
MGAAAVDVGIRILGGKRFDWAPGAKPTLGCCTTMVFRLSGGVGRKE